MVHIITVETLDILKIWRDFAFTVINREKRCFNST